MTSTRRLCLTMWLTLQGACASAPVVRSDGTSHARSQLARMVREQELPGAQYLALSTDRTLLDVHLGVADVATGTPLRRDTLHMAYSVTKVVTAIAVMQLVDAGKLELDAPLHAYWPHHPYGDAVTIRALLAHTAGVPNPMPLDWFAVKGEPLDRDAQLRQILARHSKRSDDVGESYAYSNVGYWLLEKAIEAASGQDYAQYVSEHLLEPLGVSRDAYAFDLDAQHSFATGHARRYSPMTWLLHLMTPSRYWDEAHRGWSRSARVRPHGLGYGGLFCSAAALAPLLQDLLRPQPALLSAHARDVMLSDPRDNAGAALGSTLGWVIGALDGARYFGKQGGGLGFHGNVRIYPKLGLATVLLANRTEISPGPIDARSDVLDAGFVAELQASRAQ